MVALLVFVIGVLGTEFQKRQRLTPFHTAHPTTHPTPHTPHPTPHTPHTTLHTPHSSPKVLAKYMVEAFYEKESKVAKKKEYYDKLIKQPWGVIDEVPPKERYDYERIRDLKKQKWIRKFPPIATCGEEAYERLKNHAQIEYFSYGVEDFALHLPSGLIPSKRILLLRYKNRYDSLVQSLVLKGINVTSAYPVTWMRKEWSPQEERLAKEVDVVYLHEEHAVREWRERMGTREKEAVAACHDEDVARAAKSMGFKDIFYARKGDIDGLTKTVLSAVEFAKSADYGQRAKNNG